MAYDVKTKKAWSSKLVLGLLFVIILMAIIVATITIPAVGAFFVGIAAAAVAGLFGFLGWMATGQTVVAIVLVTGIAFIVFYRRQIFTRKRTIIQSPLAGSMATPYMSNIPSNVMNPVLPNASPVPTQEIITEVKPAS